MIPWAILLKHAPALISAADALLHRAKANKPGGAQGIEERLSSLEQGSRDSAQLLHELTRQVHALTMAQEAAARQARTAVRVAVIAFMLAVCVIVIAVIGL